MEEETETCQGHLICSGKQPGSDKAELKLKSVRLQHMFVNNDTVLNTTVRHLDPRENEERANLGIYLKRKKQNKLRIYKNKKIE